MPTRARFPIVGLGLLLAVCLSACGSSAPTASGPPTPPSSGPTSAILPGPPPEIGDGSVCGASVDRVFGLNDGISLRAIATGPHAPTDPVIRQALAAYIAGRSTELAAAHTIASQCSAYGMEPSAFRACVQRRIPRESVPAAAHECLRSKHDWTVFVTQ